MANRAASFERAVKDQHNHIKTHLKMFFHHLVEQGCSEKERINRLNACCVNIVHHCNTLQTILNSEDFPPWLQPILNSSKKYQTEPSFKVFEPIHKFYSEVETHNWNFRDKQGVDFDSIYKEYKDKSQLPLLIDELIGLLKKIIDENGDELQAKTLKDLTNLLDTVIKNKDGSASAVESCFWLVLDFIKNSLFTFFPAAQISADGYETVKKIIDVCKKANDESEKVRTQIAERTNEQFNYGAQYNQLAQIDYKTIIPDEVMMFFIEKDA